MGIFAWLRFIITVAIAIGVFVASVIAFVDAIRMPAEAYTHGGKRTKKFWLLVLAAGLLFAVMGGVGMTGIMLNILAIAPAAIYWYDVRPVVKPARAFVSRYAGDKKVANFNRREKVVEFGSFDSRAAGNPNDPRFDV